MSDNSNGPDFGLGDSVVAPEATEQVEGIEGEESLEAAPEGEQKLPKVEAKKVEALKKKLKLIVDGEEFEEEYDPNDEEWMKRQLQMAKAGQKRMGEKAQLEKEVKAFIDELRKNPRKALASDLVGLDFKELVDEFVKEEIEKASKSPEQLEKEAIAQELKELKEAKQREEEERKARDLERLEEQEAARFDTLFTQAMDKHGLPKTPYTVKKMADYMSLAYEQAHKLGREIDITPDEIAPLIKEETQGDLKQLIDSMSDEDFEKFVSKERITKLRKRDIEAAKKIKAPKVAPKSNEQVKAPEKIDYKKFFGV